MNTRKMLAKLGPKTPQLTRAMFSGGGAGSLTPQDIAAALGCVRVQPGRDLYEFLWVPNMDKNTKAKLSLIMRFCDELHKEQARRYKSKNVRDKPFPDPPKKLCEDGKGGHSLKAFGFRLAHCCLNEMTRRNDCLKCRGYGETFSLNSMTFSTCSQCLGSGTVAFSQDTRSQLFNIRRETFRNHVEQAYIWLLGHMREQEQQAAEEHWRALSE